MIEITAVTLHEGEGTATHAEVEVTLSTEKRHAGLRVATWPASILERIADHLKWDAARETACEESNDGLRRVYYVHRRYYWDVRFTVDATCVADGFSLDDERAHDMIHQHLGSSYGYEVDGKVLRAPDADSVAREQGYTGKDDPRLREP